MMTGMASNTPLRSWPGAAIVIVLAAVLAACSGSATTVSTHAAVTTTFVTATVPVTTAVPTSTTVPVTSPTTAPLVVDTTSTSTSTTTTEPLGVRELVLFGDGLGAARFGAEAEGVIGYLTSVLGGTTGDTGWVDPFSFADCGAGGAATIARRVDWGVLSLLFSDGSNYANGRRHFIGYEYGRVGQVGDEPQGLRTPGGVTLGSRVVDLAAEFGDVRINEGDPEIDIPDNFYVSDVFYGLLTGTDVDDVVTVIFGGYGCGE
ncbi:MAG: hypothetical protein ACO4CU_07225 [Ilumatobacteraceae bacterium]